MSDLHGLDVVMAVILALSVLVGAWRGLIFELMSLAGWLVAYIAAMAFFRQVGAFLPIGEANSSLNSAAAIGLTFFVALLLWSMLAKLVRMLVAATPLTVPDRLLGAGFGALRGVLVLLVLVTVFSLTPTAQSPWWQASRGVQWLAVAIGGLKPLLPADVVRWLPSSKTPANGPKPPAS